jgi:TPR repeat protein
LHEDGEAIKWLYKAHIMATEQEYFDFGLKHLYRGHGWTFLTKKDREGGVTFIRAYNLLEEIAHNHNKWAYRYLGDIFLRYMPANNFKQGILYYEQAALLGDEESKPFVGITTGQDGNTGYAEIGKVFYEGIGTTPQPERAVEYFEIGTKHHNFKSIDESNCYFYLGLSYYEGKGNEQDYRKAWGNFVCATGWDHKKWPTIEDALKDPEYKKTYHNTEAMRYLSRCYRFGRGCEKDLKQAEDLLALAALTDEEMKKLLEETKNNNP